MQNRDKSASRLAMKRFIEGEDRRQGFLLPEYLDDYVTEENQVQVIEAFVEGLDLAALGFEGMSPATMGRPSYHPSVLLKIYVYSYLNQIASSRRLQREAQRNVELMWLTGRLAPDFKTIADFRKDNGPAIRATCRQFIAMPAAEPVRPCGGRDRRQQVQGGERSRQELHSRQAEEADRSGRGQHRALMSTLETADRQEGEVAQAKSSRMRDKIAALRKQMAVFKSLEPVLQAARDEQLSLTDPDARSMATSGARQRQRRLQRAMRRGYGASPHRRPRGHQCRPRQADGYIAGKKVCSQVPF
jgi:transposase